MKKCCNCQQEKTFESFHKDATAPSGYSSYCKLCKKQKDTKYYSYSEQEKKRKTKYRLEFPERKNAQSKVYRAVKFGKLIKQPCFICGEDSEAHHPDYSRPLDVVWLCSSHHRQAHNLIANFESYQCPTLI
jgi:hypothetical protein